MPFILLTPFSILLSCGAFTPFLFGSEPLEPPENRKHVLQQGYNWHIILCFISLLLKNEHSWLSRHIYHLPFLTAKVFMFYRFLYLLSGLQWLVHNEFLAAICAL